MILERIHSVIVNLVLTYNIKDSYIDEYGPRLGILAAAAFTILSTTNSLKGCTPGLLMFGCGMILLIKYTLDWELNVSKIIFKLIKTTSPKILKV